MQRRNTNQKQIVYNAIMTLGHSNTERLIDYINKNFSNISLATIYRNLNILIEENKIKKLSVGNLDVYEVIREKHFHFKCTKCGDIIDIPKSNIKSYKSLINLGDNEISDCDIVFYGVCQKCKNIQ
ncbi:MAG: transcriptional repressor [Acholeplasmatales bacterium]|nr:transcriptional repressor [Acholeplasmatales bacterium]